MHRRPSAVLSSVGRRAKPAQLSVQFWRLARVAFSAVLRRILRSRTQSVTQLFGPICSSGRSGGTIRQAANARLHVGSGPRSQLLTQSDLISHHYRTSGASSTSCRSRFVSPSELDLMARLARDGAARALGAAGSAIRSRGTGPSTSPSGRRRICLPLGWGSGLGHEPVPRPRSKQGAGCCTGDASLTRTARPRGDSSQPACKPETRHGQACRETSSGISGPSTGTRAVPRRRAIRVSQCS
jgi:hypothetical protein